MNLFYKIEDEDAVLFATTRSADGATPLALGTYIDYEQRLRIYIDDATGKYKYKFDEDEIVFRFPFDNVTFRLVNEIPNARAEIVKHVSSDGKDTTDPGSKLILLEKLPALPDKVIDATTAYPTKIVRIRMREGNFGTYEMVHIGLIVAITPDGETKPRYMLCDPQVGNGPP